MLTEFKRVKHGEQPGEISRWAKIYMRESKARKGSAFYYFPWQFISEGSIKTFLKYLSSKSKTRQRRRDKEVTANQLKEHLNDQGND